MSWPLEIDGWAVHPIPESWLDHPSADDHDADAPPQAVRLFATSVGIAPNGRALRVRYLHPRGDGVLVLFTSACPGEGEGTRAPCALVDAAGVYWPRSYVPQASKEPDDVCRAEERDHFETLWADRLPPHDAASRQRGEPA